MTEKTNHHYIPQFYLRGFGDGGDGRKAKVFVYDRDSNKTFKSNIRNIGSRRNFNRVEVEGHDPNSVEDAFASAESEIALHLREVMDAKSFPTSEHFVSVMNLIAWIALRNPRMRSTVEDFHRRVAETVMGMTYASKERYDATTRQMKAQGKEVGDISYEEMKAFIERKEYEIGIDQTYLIGLELRALDVILKPLMRRQWSFAVAAPGASFITSDEPAVLTWTDEKMHHSHSPPGHALRDTMLIFPLSPELALIGVFDEIMPLSVHDRNRVALINSAIMAFSDRQVYARDDMFELHVGWQRFVTGKDLPAAMKSRVS